VIEMCGCCSTSVRSFPTKEERVEMLEEYQEALNKESKGVMERIKELKKNN
jgi:hypothetical protein